jgi:four helix bundle protein
VKDFRRLSVWEKAHGLVVEVYLQTRGFPDEERFGLTRQIRGAAVSVASNIAEGCGRGGDAELARFLHIALGSASELEYQLLLARDLGYLEQNAYQGLHAAVEEVKQMLTGLIRRLSAGAPRRRRSLGSGGGADS